MRYDLAVIGSGSVDGPLALDFANRGKRVVLFDTGRLAVVASTSAVRPEGAPRFGRTPPERARRASDVQRALRRARRRPGGDATRCRRSSASGHDGVEPQVRAQLRRAGASRGVVSRAARRARRRRGLTRPRSSSSTPWPGERPRRSKVSPGRRFSTNENFFLQETLPRQARPAGVGLHRSRTRTRCRAAGQRGDAGDADDRIIAREDDRRVQRLDALVHAGRYRSAAAAEGRRGYERRDVRGDLDDGSTLDATAARRDRLRRPNIPRATTERAGDRARRARERCASTSPCRPRWRDTTRWATSPVSRSFTHVRVGRLSALKAILTGQPLRATRDDRVLAYANVHRAAGRPGRIVRRSGRASAASRIREVTLQLADVARGRSGASRTASFAWSSPRRPTRSWVPRSSGTRLGN